MGVLVLVVTVWVALNMYVKVRFDRKRSNLPSYTKVEMTAASRTLVAKVTNEWNEVYSLIGGPHAKALNLIGSRATVGDLVKFFTEPLPGHSVLSVKKSLNAKLMCDTFEILAPITLDGSIHVSADASIAMFRVNERTILVFSDEQEGLREALYQIKKDTKDEAD
jgi:hypothetical protein